MRLGLSAVTLMSLAVAAVAQPPGPPGTMPVMMLSQQSVQRELQLTPQQIQQAYQAASRHMMEARKLFASQPAQREKMMQELQAADEKTIDWLLKPAQRQRLDEIRLQVQGAHAYTDANVIKELGLTDDQKFLIGAIQDEARGKMMEILPPPPGQPGQRPGPPRQPPNFAGIQKKTAEMNKAADEKFQKLLTNEQKEKWQKLLGKPFTGEIRMGPPGLPPPPR